MIGGTFLVGYYTARGWGRKPFYLLHLSMHSIRVFLLILCLYTNAGKGWLVSTELIGGLTGAFGIVNAFMRADILFGSGRMNVVDGYQATIRGIAATSSQYIGGVILENKGPMTSLMISFIISLISPMIGLLYVPETLGMRETDFKEEKEQERLLEKTRSMDHYDEHSHAINYVHMELT
jgi:MFS family permease